MHLNLARSIGKKNGAETDLECIFYVVKNAEELLGLENVWIELKELFEEAEAAGIELPGTGFGAGPGNVG